MPTSDAILTSATWHLALALLLMFLVAGRRPSERTLALAIATPLISVSALAWSAGNPFNGLMFAALAAAAWRPRRFAEGFGTAVMVLALAAGAQAQAQTQEDSPAVKAFISATRDYAIVHRRIERQLPQFEISSDAETIRRAVEAMADAMRVVRADAKQGDFFTPALVAEIRARINTALREHGFSSEDIRVAEWLDGIDPSTARLAVNGTFPWAYGSAMFPCVIAALPPLPPELQYRVVGNTLVLIDTHASLIVDLLPHALTESTTEFQVREFP